MNVITIPSKVITPTGRPTPLPMGAVGLFMNWVTRGYMERVINAKLSAAVEDLLEGPINTVLSQKLDGGYLIEVPIYEFPQPRSPFYLSGNGVLALGWGRTPVFAGVNAMNEIAYRPSPPKDTTPGPSSFYLWVSKDDEGNISVNKIDYETMSAAIVSEYKSRERQATIIEGLWKSDPGSALTETLEQIEYQLEQEISDATKRANALELAKQAAELKLSYHRVNQALKQAKSDARRAQGLKTIMTILRGAQIGSEFVSGEGTVTEKSLDKQQQSSAITIETQNEYRKSIIMRHGNVINQFHLIIDKNTGQSTFLDRIIELPDQD